MQDWREQVRSKGIDILDFGDCQFCGAPLDRGVSRCIDISGCLSQKISHEDGIKYMSIFLCVDAHALQHSEIHGRWSNHFHLTRLELILNTGIHWDYKLSPLLSGVVEAYKKKHNNEKIIPPETKKRGDISVYEVNNARDAGEYIQLVDKWARSVYTSFKSGHAISKEIARLFCGKYR